MDALVKIANDVLDIASRLKEIDPRYEVYRNLNKHRFEIHAEGALQIAVPFNRLDERTLSLVRETRLENADALFKRLDKQNAEAERALLDTVRDRVMTKVEEVL